MKTSLLLALMVFAAAPLSRAAEAKLAVDEQQSRIEYDVKATVDSFTGKLPVYDLSLTADPESGKVLLAQLHFRWASMRTGKEKRDVEMRHWQGTDQFPEAVFTMVSLEPSADGKFTAKGQFLMHGQTKDLTFPVTVTVADKKTWTIDGEVPINTQDFGLPVIRKALVLKVDPVVKVRFHIQASLSQK